MLAILFEQRPQKASEVHQRVSQPPGASKGFRDPQETSEGLNMPPVGPKGLAGLAGTEGKMDTCMDVLKLPSVSYRTLSPLKPLTITGPGPSIGQMI